jgi:hypothetical protein
MVLTRDVAALFCNFAGPTSGEIIDETGANHSNNTDTKTYRTGAEAHMSTGEPPVTH